MTHILQAICLAALGNSTIYAGLAFVNGKLLTRWLDGVYDQTTAFHRLVIMLITASMAANYLLARVYKLVDAGTASMSILGTLVIVMITKSLLIEGVSLNMRIVAAALCLILTAVWVSYELHRP